MIKLVWDDEMGECTIRLPAKFKEMDRISQLDFVNDAIAELENLHNYILSAPSAPRNEGTGGFPRILWKNFQSPRPFPDSVDDVHHQQV